MNFNAYIDNTFAKLLYTKGYHKYSKKQYIIYDDKTSVEDCHFNIGECAVFELSTPNMTIIYVPTILELTEWIYKHEPEWNISVLWDNNLKGYYFYVQNIKTDYEYKQPCSPKNDNKETTYEWGLEHVIRRMNLN